MHGGDRGPKVWGTGVAAGAIETTGSASVALVALVLAKDVGGLPAASCTGFAPAPVGTV